MKKNKQVVIRNSKDLAKALNLSDADHEYMVYKAEMGEIVRNSILKCDLMVNEIAARAGISRGKVSAMKNGAVAGISIDLMIRVVAATGQKLTLKAS